MARFGGPTDAGTRIENFNRRYEPTIGDIANPWYSPVQLQFAADSKRRFYQKAVVDAVVQRRVQQVLNQEGVATILYAAYFAYGAELQMLIQGGSSGTSLQLEALVLLNKWVARGLTQSVLEAIRLQVFNITAPAEAPPPPAP